MKSFDEYMTAKTGTGAEEIVVEGVTAGDDVEVLSEATVGAAEEAVSAWIKKTIGVNVRVEQLNTNGRMYMIKPDGAHGKLCHKYYINLQISQNSDEKHGDYWGVRASLKWDYKTGGSNGTDMGTIFVGSDGKVIATRPGF